MFGLVGRELTGGRLINPFEPGVEDVELVIVNIHENLQSTQNFMGYQKEKKIIRIYNLWLELSFLFSYTPCSYQVDSWRVMNSFILVFATREDIL